MSSRKPDLSREAENDLVEILLFTGKQWGAAQVRRYRDKLKLAFAEIDRNPCITGSCPGLPEEYRRFLVGSHMIVYRIREGKVQILRILHQRMSLDAMQGDLSD